jgi:DNA processing protein
LIDSAELAAWLQLLCTPKVGRESARHLLKAFGSPEAVLAASTAARSEVVPLAMAGALASAPDGLAALVRATLHWLQTADECSIERSIITLGDCRYPKQLLESPDPPLLLYTQGRADLLHATSVAMVGSRNPTPQGIENAQHFAGVLSQAGCTIVSGLALGIDAAAHDGALPHLGSTIAVVGTGLDRVYPRQNLNLAHRIAQTGLILSEYPIGSAPIAHHFPQRNRIIAGLSQGLVVVEAALKSGSLISARLASEAGREVFAMPGSIHAPQAKGCHQLIKQGAKLVETAQDILEELVFQPHRPVRSSGAPNTTVALSENQTLQSEHPLLRALDFSPITLDALQVRTGLSAAELNTQLLALEFDGQVARLAGQQFQRLAVW